MFYDFSCQELVRNDTYRAEHKAIIEDELSFVCTYKEGLDILDLIDRIRSFGNNE